MDFCIEEFYEVLCTECEREGLAYRRDSERVYIEDFAYFVYISEKKIKARNDKGHDGSPGYWGGPDVPVINCC